MPRGSGYGCGSATEAEVARSFVAFAPLGSWAASVSPRLPVQQPLSCLPSGRRAHNRRTEAGRTFTEPEQTERSRNLREMPSGKWLGGHSGDSKYIALKDPDRQAAEI